MCNPSPVLFYVQLYLYKTITESNFTSYREIMQYPKSSNVQYTV